MSSPTGPKGDTIKYKKLLAGTLVELQEKIFSYLSMLDKKTDRRTTPGD